MQKWNKWILVAIAIIFGLSLWYVLPASGGSATRDLILAPDIGTISGTVTDISSSKPVADLEVKLDNVGGGQQTTVKTDASGKFSFPNLKYGSYKLEIARTDYDTIAYNVDLDPGEQLNLNFSSIPSVISIKGEVHNSVSDEPIKEATVLLGDKAGLPLVTATTDSLGRYGLTVTLPGSYTLKASHSDYEAGTGVPLEFAGQVMEQSFKLQPKPGQVSGTVTNLSSTGTPLSDAVIKLYKDNTLVTSATSDDTGAYSFADVPQGSYTLTVTLGSYLERSLPLQVSANQAVKLNLPLSPPGTSLKGSVINSATNAPLSGAEVKAVNSDNNEVATTLTDEQGRYVLASLPHGKLTVTASKSGYKTLVRSSTNVSFSTKGFHFGLDVNGGTQLIYKADLSQKDPKMTDGQVMDSLKNKIERRINAYGVSEPTIQRLGNDRILVQLPGIKNVDEAVKLIGEMAQLDFRVQRLDSQGNPVLDENGNYVWEVATGTGASGQTINLEGKYFEANASVTFDQSNKPQVAFEWKREAAPAFQEVTGKLVNGNQPLGIFLDNKLISAPRVQAVIKDKGVITGVSLSEAKKLAIELNSGSLDVPVSIDQQKSVDATLGKDSLHKSYIAGVIGFALVLLFMLFYYRVPGLLAVSALCIYAAIVMALFKLIPITLTLPGIAGFIISLGMAVDANILVFERMKEELRAGRNLKTAVEEGFRRAWPSIRDSNISTFITCAVLYWFGSKYGAFMVKGFALTLFIGVAVSMFSALTVTRTFLRALVNSGRVSGLSAYGISTRKATASQPAGNQASPSKSSGMMDFVGKRYWYFLLSAIIIVPGIISLSIFHLKPGVDFSGGTAVTFHFSGDVKESQLRTDLKDLGYGDATVQHTSAGDFFVRLKELTGDQKAKLIDGLQKATGYTVTTPDYYTASATVGSKTARNAAIAVIVASVAILLYITLAFRRMPRPFRWGTCAVVALIHDVLVVAGIFSILGWAAGIEVDALFITGMLTVVGYSVHDTIVVFDRIRENTIKGVVKGFEERVNFSIVETLIRSLNTSFTVLLAVLALYLIGGSSIHNFVLVLLIGVITGTYSSVFNASMLLVVWEKGEFSKLGKLWPWRAKA